MVRPKNQLIWNHFRETDNKSATCKYCEIKYKVANLQKMARHLLKCLHCPENCKQQLKANLSQSSSVSADGNMILLSSNKENERPESELSLSIESGASSVNLSTNLNKEHLNSLLAKAIYVSGTPLSIVEHPLWINFFAELQPLYKCPTRKTISTSILDKTYKEMHQELKENMISQTCLHLMLDGWSNCRNEGIINIIIAKPEPLFVKSIATVENRHTGHYICEEILNVLSEYGVNKFATMIGDNGSNMQKAFRLVNDVHPNITYLNCAAHTLNLLSKNIIRIDVINACKNMAINMVKTIKKSQVLTSLLAKIVKEKKTGETLKLPCDTRWGSYYTTFKSIENTKVALQTLAVHEKATLLPAEEKSALLDDNFWKIIRQCKLIMKTISDAIFQLEGNENNIRKVFLTLKNMKSKLLFSLNDVTIIESSKKDEILIIVDERIKMCLKPIHFAAYLLDPTDQGTELDERQEVDAMEFIYDVGQSIGLNVMTNLASYRARDGFWSRRFLWANVNEINASTWWKGICGCTALSKVAVRILTAPCTSAAVERSFSALSNKKRNRLTTERAAKLTYITYNWNLLHKHIDDSSDNTEDCIPDSPPPPILIESRGSDMQTTPLRTTSPEPSTSGTGINNNFEFLDCNLVSDSSDDE